MTEQSIAKKEKERPPIQLASWTMLQFAQRHSVCLATCYNWHKRGWLKTVKIGRVRRVLPQHEQDFLNRFNAA